MTQGGISLGELARDELMGDLEAVVGRSGEGGERAAASGRRTASASASLLSRPEAGVNAPWTGAREAGAVVPVLPRRAEHERRTELLRVEIIFWRNDFKAARTQLEN